MAREAGPAADPRPAPASPRLAAALARAARALTEPSPAVGNEDGRRRARLLAAMLVLMVPASLAASLLSTTLARPGPAPWESPLAHLGALAAAAGLAAYALSRSRHHAAGAWLTVGLAMLGTWGAVALSGGTPHASSSPYFLSLSVILASALLPLPATVAIAGGNLALVALLPSALPGLGYFDAATAGLFLFFVSAFILVFAAVRRGDLRHMERQAERLAESEGKLRAVLTHAPDTVLLLDRAGSVLYANRPLPWRPGEPPAGLGLSALVPPGDRARLEALLGRVFDEATAARLDVRCPGPGGAEGWYTFRLAPAHRDGRVGAATLIVTDVTEVRRAEEERLRSAARAQEIERLREVASFKSNFMNLAAHELRTPLTPIRTNVYLLRRHARGLDPPQRAALEAVDRNVRRMAELVEEVLEGARLQSGKLALRRRTVEVGQAVAEAVGAHRAAAEEAGVRLEARVGPGLRVDADPARLGQVLETLLSNALRFTPRGGRVGVSAEARGEAAVLEVRDDGRGLSAGQLESLFQPFSELHHLEDATSRGNGLGLYIAKELVERHGGTIACASEGPGRGATFTVTLPLVRAEAPEAAAAL